MPFILPNFLPFQKPRICLLFCLCEVLLQPLKESIMSWQFNSSSAVKGLRNTGWNEIRNAMFISSSVQKVPYKTRVYLVIHILLNTQHFFSNTSCREENNFPLFLFFFIFVQPATHVRVGKTMPNKNGWQISCRNPIL